MSDHRHEARATIERPDVAAVLDRLKGFQRDTVGYAFERLYLAPDSSHRFLVADEVGLGKTLVARGVVAKAVDHLWETVERIDVVYICSNANIARQNVRRISPFPEGETHRIDRLTLLPAAVRDLKGRKVNLIAFTPGTSFHLKSSGGRWEERVVLYWLVQRIWPRKGTAPKNLMQGGVSKTHWFRGQLKKFNERQQIDPTLAEAFARRIERKTAADRRANHPTLRERYDDLCDRFHYARKHIPQVDRDDQFRFIGELRSLLAGTCLDALEPDLVILDEFQRFKDLLDGDDEAAVLAQRLFDYSAKDDPDVRVLMLSATPYKMYTLHHEAHEDDHYTDFLRTVKFIGGDRTAHGEFRKQLDEYRRELYRLGDTGGTEELGKLKVQIEGHLRKQMCRTERVRSTESSDGMLREVPTPGVSLTTDDVAGFRSLARVAELVGQPGVVEYWKSAPYLLSCMDNYKLKTEFEEVLESRGLSREIRDEVRTLTFPWEEFERYGRIDPQNARLRSLLAWLDEAKAWRLLWLPPTLPYYRLRPPFDDTGASGVTKRLVFSAWTVVPKTIASLVSYEVERRIFTEHSTGTVESPEERSQRRPLLRFTRSEGRLTGMPVLGILYPSPSLAGVADPLLLAGRQPEGAGAPEAAEAPEAAGAPGAAEAPEGAGAPQDARVPAGPQLDRVLQEIQGSLSEGLRSLVERHADEESAREDESWYWAAPILLDLELCPEETRDWFANRNLPADWASGDEDADSGWREHVDLARSLVEGEVALGRPPHDLEQVLALVALAAPGNVALRALSRTGLGGLELPDPVLRTAAGRVAWGFRSLFNQPEALEIVRGGWSGSEETPYWQLVLHYSAAGCLQAVLDEYTHLVRDLDGWIDATSEETVEGVAESVVEALTLRASLSYVDEIDGNAPEGARLRTRRLRNHFALRFGTQSTADGDGSVRIDRVRGAFNSPFWPFVLATTSFGQEGLDFHAYSHAVVHWNLPANPVDLEQREGRVHRYKGHAVRKNVVETAGQEALRDPEGDVWNRLFELAADGDGASRGLRPYWVCPGKVSIERHVPRLPLSRDEHQYEALQRSLAVYRMVFGQPRQDDLMAFLLERLGPERIRELMPTLRIDLGPGEGVV